MASPDVMVLSQPVSLPAKYQTETFTWGEELKHLFSTKFINILWWPVFQWQQRYITKSRLLQECKRLPGFSNLWRTIQKGSFAYNILFLHSNPSRQNFRSTDLADITTLALFFGDEFIDGIYLTVGKRDIQKILTSNKYNFCMQVKHTGNSVKVVYAFDLLAILPPAVMETINEKYFITYNKFYELLRLFLVMINKHLKKMDNVKAKKTARKIADVCNNCFDSYLNDVTNCPLQDSENAVPYLSNIHDLKTRKMQKKLLELRCILAEKEALTCGDDMDGWLDIMSVVQVYDDLQDVVLDDGLQDNMVLCMAKKHFHEEWKWFLQNKKNLTKQKQQHGMYLSLNMPCSVHFCLQVAADKIKNMNWEQQKIMHYLLAKNWFSKNHTSLQGDIKDRLSSIYKLLKPKMNNTPEHIVKGYAVDTCFHDEKASSQVLKKVNYKTAYQLRYNLLAIPAHTKAKIFDAVVEL